MNDVRPERAWFEKAGQDLEMACRALGPEKPLPEEDVSKNPETPKILSIQIQISAVIR
jgi:hypothetical protein